MPDTRPAFPVIAKPHLDKGMTLRDYLAAQIAAGDAAAGEGWEVTGGGGDDGLVARARFYYRLADAMIKVRDE
ncbi:MAG: hypothetical protein WBA73_16140 [Devosia sp.]